MYVYFVGLRWTKLSKIKRNKNDFLKLRFLLAKKIIQRLDVMSPQIEKLQLF